MKRFLLGLLMGATLFVPVGAGAEDIGDAVSWTKRTIWVPGNGYFVNHGHCRTEDMVLVKLVYPGVGDRRFHCVHVDKIAKG
jgi:hypothetical protein